jgi:hypothetical protein
MGLGRAGIAATGADFISYVVIEETIRVDAHTLAAISGRQRIIQPQRNITAATAR